MTDARSLTLRIALTGLSAAVLLSACGGGGGSSSQAAAPPVSQPGGNVWTQGQFAAASQFKDLCAAPRSGVDLNGNAFPDRSGTLSDELFWLRSWSDETYLWYNEITDQDPNGFSDRLAYFDELKTTATTPSGNPRDRFHFTYDSEEWLRLTTSGASASYGARFALVDSAPPRDIRVAFVEPGSPAATAGLSRGLKVITVNGVDAINGTDTTTLNAGLFPDNAGETYTFEFERLDGTRFTTSLTSAIVTSDPVNAVSVFEENGRRYGYIHFTTFSPRTAEEALFDAFDQLQAASIDDLVLDMRYNGGGLLAIASQLSYMVAGPAQTAGRSFETLQFNSKANGINPVTGNAITPTPFYTNGQNFTVPPSRNAPTVSRPRVFVLTTDRTCSASEAVMNGLRGIDVEVIQIGGRTCGKPYGFYATDNCGITYFTIQFRGVNDKNFGDYADGFAPGEAPSSLGDVMPGCDVDDDFSHALGDRDEALLATAISYAETGSCPAGTVPNRKIDSASDLAQRLGHIDPALDLRHDPRIQARDLAETRTLRD
ncbi:MAG: S41 family peptidase [Pseudomonadota bacterium]